MIGAILDSSWRSFGEGGGVQTQRLLLKVKWKMRAAQHFPDYTVYMYLYEYEFIGMVQILNLLYVFIVCSEEKMILSLRTEHLVVSLHFLFLFA